MDCTRVLVHTKERMPQLFEPLLDDKQAAGLLGMHEKTLQRMARRGEVPCYRIGRFWRYRASELNCWLRGRLLNKSMDGETGEVESSRQAVRVDSKEAR